MKWNTVKICHQHFSMFHLYVYTRNKVCIFEKKSFKKCCKGSEWLGNNICINKNFCSRKKIVLAIYRQPKTNIQTTYKLSYFVVCSHKRYTLSMYKRSSFIDSFTIKDMTIFSNYTQNLYSGTEIYYVYPQIKYKRRTLSCLIKILYELCGILW